MRGPWRLTQSLGAIARNVMGNKAQVGWKEVCQASLLMWCYVGKGANGCSAW